MRIEGDGEIQKSKRSLNHYENETFFGEKKYPQIKEIEDSSSEREKNKKKKNSWWLWCC